MNCNGSCREFCAWIETLPCHVMYTLPKGKIPKLPDCFQETWLGEATVGANRQFRGPCGAHVHEFAGRWELHRDRADASRDPLGHLTKDVPEYLASAFLAVLVAAITRRHSKSKALLAAGLASTMALAAGKILKMLNGDPADGKDEGPWPR